MTQTNTLAITMSGDGQSLTFAAGGDAPLTCCAMTARHYIYYHFNKA